jgi:hypothetical protein
MATHCTGRFHVAGLAASRTREHASIDRRPSVMSCTSPPQISLSRGNPRRTSSTAHNQTQNIGGAVSKKLPSQRSGRRVSRCASRSCFAHWDAHLADGNAFPRLHAHLDFGGLADHGGPGLLDRGDFLLVGGAESSG